VPAHYGAAADALRAHGEQVVALALHAHAELDRAQGALLPERGLEVGQLGGAGEVELRGVAAPSQRFGGQRGVHGSRVCRRRPGRR
jgi:hypothetical protein